MPEGEGQATGQGSTTVEHRNAEGAGASVTVNQGEELVPISRVRDLQSTNDRLRTRIGELEGQLGGAGEAAQTAQRAADEARQLALGEHRRALIAENRDQIVEELVQGNTTDELQASVERARGAFSRIAAQTRQQLAEQRVPAGTPARSRDLTPEQLAALSPTEKIARGLADRA